jgi:hypothetical protein
LNFRDAATKRYTKNPTRLDNELRAEAMDYHQRQPYAVLVAIVYVPEDACSDGNPGRKAQSWSSFAQIVNVLRHRAHRRLPTDDLQLFERLYVGLYRHKGTARGDVMYFDSEKTVPQFDAPDPSLLLDFDHLLADIVKTYDKRNTVEPAWATETVEEIVPLATLIEEELLPPDDDGDDDSPVG